MVTRGKTDCLLAYLAGIVDADGHVALHVARQPAPSQDHRSPRYSPEIVVTNTDPRLIELLLTTFGGRFYVRKKVQPHHKTTYSWKATNLAARRVAEALAPYALLKQAQMEIIIEFYEKASRERTHNRGRMIPEEAARRLELYTRLRTLVDDRRPQRLSEEAPVTDG